MRLNVAENGPGGTRTRHLSGPSPQSSIRIRSLLSTKLKLNDSKRDCETYNGTKKQLRIPKWMQNRDAHSRPQKSSAHTPGTASSERPCFRIEKPLTIPEAVRIGLEWSTRNDIRALTPKTGNLTSSAVVCVWASLFRSASGIRYWETHLKPMRVPSTKYLSLQPQCWNLNDIP